MRGEEKMKFLLLRQLRKKLKEIFGEEEKIKTWLNTPLESLQGKTPLEVLNEKNKKGEIQIIKIIKILEILSKLEWGIPD